MPAGKAMGYKRPKNTKKALKTMLRYLGLHRFSLLAVALLVLISSGANLLGTYLLRPIINRYILPGDIPGLAAALVLMGAMYGVGVLATWGYNQLMVHTSQKVIGEIRADLFRHTQTLPLSYFDAHTHGELMSRFTNDVDTLNDALNNSFSLLIQSCHHGHRHHHHAGGAEPAAVSDRRGVSCRHVPVHPIQQPAQQKVL